MKKIIPKISALVLSGCLVALSACAPEPSSAPFVQPDITFTLMNGDHYTVTGGNQVKVQNGEAVFRVKLEAGYMFASTAEAGATVSGELGWEKTVTFSDIRFTSAVQLNTEAFPTFPLAVNHSEGGSVTAQSFLGSAGEGKWYEGDTVTLTAEPSEDYYFCGWTTGGYLKDGGKLFDEGNTLCYASIPSYDAVYANFRALSDYGNFLVYDLGFGQKIYQDCSALVANHPKANTLTEPDLTEDGYLTGDEEKMLIGWETEDGEFIGLGSRASVKGEGPSFLKGVWKQYSDSALFTVDNGKITHYLGAEEEVVIPRKIDGKEITSIGANAFEGCTAKAFYVPSTVNTIETNAFLNCTTLTDFYFSDNLTQINDNCFTGCRNFTTMHVNAVLPPVYLQTDYGKADVFNLLEMRTGKRIAVAGGSSVTYGYITSKINEILEGYTGFNFGYTLGVSSSFWCDLIMDFLEEGDIFLHAPELQNVAVFSDTNTSPLDQGPHFWVIKHVYYLLEGDWSLASHLKVNDYCNLFAQYGEFTREKADAVSHGQALSYADHDSLGEYGNTPDWNVGSGYENYSWNANGPLIFEAVADNAFFCSGELMYNPLAAKGVKVYFMFPPLNRSNLFTSYGASIEGACATYTERAKRMLAPYPITVLLSQIDAVYPSECFVNSDYHLGNPTNREHTAKVMNAIKETL